MTALRLIPRLLLSLLVGLTIFGGVGWLLRPRPRWSVSLDARQGYHEFVEYSEPGLNNEPVWIKTDEMDWDAFEDHSRYLAFDPQTGRQLCAWRKPDLRGDALHFGRRVILMLPARDNDEGTGTMFWLAGADPIRPPVLQTFDGDWSLADDGAHAWRVRTTRDFVLMLERRRLDDGADLPSVKFEGRHWNVNNSRVDYSAAYGKLAIARSQGKGDGDSSSVDAYDATTGRLISTVDPPSPEGKPLGPVRGVVLYRQHPYVQFETGDGPDSLRWIYSLDRGKFIDVPSQEPPAGAQLKLEIGYGEYEMLPRAWAALALDPPRAWVALARSPAEAAQWRRVPYPVDVHYYVHHHHGSSSVTNILEGATSEIVPGTSQLIVATSEPPLASVVPESLREWAPAALRPAESEPFCRWHDWDHGGWRDVGCRSFYLHRVRQRELLTLVRDDESTTRLECWPLPPRDPKWLSAAAGILGTALIWLLLARRALRKQRLSDQ